jgi:hypothetical protein
MTTMAIEPTTAGVQSEDKDFGKKLRNETAACRLAISQFGTTRKLTTEQRDQAAEVFNATPDKLKAAKKLLDTKAEEYKAVTEVIGAARALWKSCTHPFPEPGIRLIRRAKIEEFASQMEGLKMQLNSAVAALDAKYEALVAQAQTDLGRLFHSGDYPESIQGEFGIDWDFPSIAAPNYLQQVSPALYEAQCKRIEHQFDDAVTMFEQVSTEQLHKMVAHLCEALTGVEDDGKRQGKRKIFKDSAVQNIQEFFGRFRNLNVRSNSELNTLVDQAEQLLQGVDPKELRKSDWLRDSLATRMQEVQTALDGMLVEKPGRKFFDEA